MNIGIVTTWFERGAAYVSRQYMEVLQKTDNVFIYARGGEKYAKDDPKWNLNNVHWGKRNQAKLRIYGGTYIDKKDFESWIKANNIDIIFFNEQRYYPALLWCKDWKIRTVAYVDYYTENTIPFFDIYDCLICNTKRHAFAFRNHGNAKYIKWGTDINLYKPETQKNDRITFFTSAGMAPVRKGTDYVIRAFYQMKNRKNAKLLVHTQVFLETAIPEVKSQIEELIAEGSLEIVHKTISAPGLYSKADVYVYPSRLDGIGLTLMEAAASGLACITIDNAPMNEFVDESFGRLCSVDYYYCRHDGYYWPLSATNVESLSNIMESFANGEYDVKTMKAKAREYAERELDFSHNMEKLHSVFENVVFQANEKAYKLTNDYVHSKDGFISRFSNILMWIYFSVRDVIKR